MDCNPNALAQAAACFCFNEKLARAVKIYLLCRWAQEVAPPVVPFSYTPDTAIISWQDVSPKSGDLATFYATAIVPFVSYVNLYNQGITSITNLPLLGTGQPVGDGGYFIIVNNPLLTGVIDLSTWTQWNGIWTAPGFGNYSIGCDNCAGITSLILSNTTFVLFDVSIVGCSSLTSVVFGPATTLQSSLWASGCTSLVNIDISTVHFANAGSGLTVDFRNCGLNQTSVDNILASVKSSEILGGGGPGSGDELHLEGGTNATPGAQGLLDKAWLNANGCTTTTN